jgi:hypothetical protein
VALTGDLAVITRIRAQPIWVAEATVSPDPTQPDSAATEWRLLARMYAPYRPPVGLIEMPVGTDRRTPPFVLVRDDRAVQVLVGWCGADLAAFKQRAQGGAAEPSPFAGPPVPVPTAEQAGAFATLVQLRVALAEGERVVLRNLVVATGRQATGCSKGNGGSGPSPHPWTNWGSASPQCLECPVVGRWNSSSAARRS